jgi:hypothetical protein
MKSKNRKKQGRKGKLGHVPISANGRGKRKLGLVPIADEITHRLVSEIYPAPENDRLYKPVDPTDLDFRALVESVRAKGVLEALIVTRDGYICSGHRRHAAARIAGLETVPCRTAKIYCADPRFLAMLRDCNRQRVKTLDEVLREEVVSANPEEAYRALLEYRAQQAAVSVNEIELGAVKRRARITDAKRPFLDAILRILDEYRASWPLSVRQIHYYLLNYLPLMHAAKPDSVYRNNLKSYKALDELLTRARIAGDVSFSAIHDSTRPVICWNVFAQPGPFICSQLNRFLKGYYRDLMQSQPNHVEIIGEKNTIEGALRPVAAEYTIPYTIGRGYASLPPRHDMAVRFRRSGKQQLILLVLSDFDPEGEDIGRSFAQSMRDDFGIENIVPKKVALTSEQVRQLNLPPNLTAKATSSRRNRFVQRHGEHVFEMEAIPPPTAQQFLRDAIDAVIDVAAYNAEVALEKQDAAYLATVRLRAHAVLGELGADEDSPDASEPE